MKVFTFAIYCFIDDLLKKTQNIFIDSRRKLSDAQVITTVIIFAKYFSVCRTNRNQYAACVYMREHWGFNMPDKSNL